MSTVITSPRGAAAPERTSTEWLRCPGERAALAACVASNVVVLAVAVVLVVAGSQWLATHPRIAHHVPWMRAVVIAAIVALPAAPIGRHIKLYAARSSGVRVGPHQFAELHEQLVRASRMLGVERVPELYVSRRVTDSVAAYSVWGGSVIVLDAALFPVDWKKAIDWLGFVVASAVGAVRLGHTRLWVEVLTVYAKRIPGLRTPLLMKRTYSCDRCAAFVVPDGIRGLLVEAVGKNVVRLVDVAPFLDQTITTGGVWTYLAALQRKSPQLAARARALYEAGFFDRERDLGRGTLPAA